MAKSSTTSQAPTNPLVQSVPMGNRIYELQFVDCGKTACSRCNTPDGRKGSHGPYWYMCFSLGKKWRRVYIGKNLKTDRYILPDGRLDLATINGPHAQSTVLDKPPESSKDTKEHLAPSSPDERAEKNIKASLKRVDALCNTASGDRVSQSPGKSSPGSA